MKVGLGADSNGVSMKNEVKQFLESIGYTIEDYGEPSEDYPEIAYQVAQGILTKEIDRGILFCGTGIGMAIAANKVKGIRAAQAHDIYSAERAQLSNNAQIITMGAKVIGNQTATMIAETFLKETFSLAGTGKNSAKKIEEIMTIEAHA